MRVILWRKPGTWLRRMAWLGLVVGAAVFAFTPMESKVRAEQAVTAKAPIPEVAAACAGCHAGAAQSWAASLHRRTVGAPQIAADRQGCAACHAGTADHLADVSDVSKRPSLSKLSGDQITEICQTCHRGGKQAMWDLSAHSRTKDGCLTCHDPHNGVGARMLKAEEPALCAKCHPTQVAEGLLPSHHPIAEGKMVCSDCHNVHGDQRGNLPEASNGEMCFRCHADKEGPFIAEHPPVTEDCTICHRPHGSPVDNLLIQDQPMLCLQCHTGHSDSHRTPLVATSPGNPAALDAINGFYAKCTSCHTRIHGTDLLSQSGNPTFMPGSPLEPLSPLHIADVLSTTAMSSWGFSNVDLTRLSQRGSPQFVREWNGRDYSVPDAELGITRYGKSDDFRFELLHLPQGNQDLRLRAGSPKYDLQINVSNLTHRLGRFDDFTNAVIPGIAGGTNRVNTTDLAAGENDFKIDRTVIDARLAARCPKIPAAKFLLNYWQESRTGNRQFLFMDRCASCHKIQTVEPIDRVTTITEGGIQVDLPKSSMRYLRGEESFSNRASEEFFKFNGRGIFNGQAPLFGVAPTRTSTNDFRGSTVLSKQASAAVLWRSKDRTDRLGNGDISIRTLGGGARYVLAPSLSLQGSFFGRRLDVSPLLEEGVSRRGDTSRVDLRYTGLPHTVWSLGYSKEIVDREHEREMIPHKSDSSIWSSAVTYQPLSRWWMQLRYRNTRTDQEDFLSADATSITSSRLLGLPTEGSLLSGVVSYSIDPTTQLSGLYNRKRDRFNVDVPLLGAFRAAEDTTKTTGAQLTHSRGRGQVTAGYYRQDGDTGSNVTYGTDAFILSPPLSPAPLTFPPIQSTSKFNYRATIQNLDGSFWTTSRLRLFARYERTKTDGREDLFDLADYVTDNPDTRGLTVVLNPFDITIKDYWVGASYLVSSDTEVALSYQRRSWDDRANVTHDGAYHLWRLGLRREF